MNKLRVLIVAIMAGVLSLFTVTAATAAYTTPPVTGGAPSSVTPGGSFTVSLSTDPVSCAWTSTFTLTGGSTGADASQGGPSSSGTSYTATFQAPATGGGTVTVQCVWDPDLYTASASSEQVAEPAVPAFYSLSSASTAVQAAAQTKTYTYSVDTGIAPGGDAGSGSGSGDAEEDTNGVLPNTGGASFWVLAGGLALVAVGGGTVVATRRRHDAA